jgi:hypothetical protein
VVANFFGGSKEAVLAQLARPLPVSSALHLAALPAKRAAIAAKSE